MSFWTSIPAELFLFEIALSVVMFQLLVLQVEDESGNLEMLDEDDGDGDGDADADGDDMFEEDQMDLAEMEDPEEPVSRSPRRPTALKGFWAVSDHNAKIPKKSPT